MPVTDAISPLIRASPLAGAGADDVVVGEAVLGDKAVLGELGDVVGFDVFDELHAAMDSAVTPVTVSIANRASRGVGELTDINVSPIVGWSQRMGVPDGAVRSLCIENGIQNADSERRMMSSSMDSMTVRTPASLGSMFLAKNAAVAILP